MIGQTVGHYEILEELGGGGMGVVYRARDRRLDRTVAIKFLPAEWSRDADARERFSREARAASAIDHPHICTIYDIDETDDGRLFLVMAYCPGETLSQRITRGPLPVDLAVIIAIQIAEALSGAHDAGIVHRDIKPANVLLDDQHGVKVVDFGLAKLVDVTELTRAGSVIGTPAYMSPEQARSEQVDQRTDVWSLGVVLFEMLAGRRPFCGDSNHALIYSLLESEPPRLSEIRGETPADLRRIVDRCLEKDPNRRYSHAGELVEALRRVRGPGDGSLETTVVCPSSPGRARRLAPPVAAIVLVALALGVWSRFGNRAVIPLEKTLVVLPFSSSQTSPVASALCDGLTEEVTDTIGAMRRFRGELSVVPAIAVQRERLRNPREAMVAFGANLAVVGAVESVDGDALRVLVELVDTIDGQALRHRVISWAVGEGVTLQAALVSQLADMLDLELDELERADLAVGGTSDRKAYALYVQALGLLEDVDDLSSVRKSIDLLRQALEFDTGFVLAEVALARACRRRFQLTGEQVWINAAETYAQQSLVMDQRLPRAYVEMGLVRAAMDDPQGGLGHVERALELDPLNGRAQTAKAQILTQMGQLQAAEVVFRTAISVRPDDWIAVDNAGLFYFDRFQYSTALEFFRKEVELRPTYSFGWINLGGSLFMSGDVAKGREALERAIDIGPTYWGLFNLGTLEFYEQNYKRAGELYERALAFDDTDWEVWNNLAECLRWGGAPTEQVHIAFGQVARRVEKQLEIAPDDLDMRLSLASSLAVIGEKRRARRILEEAIAIGVGEPFSQVAVAAVWEDLGERSRALEWVGESLQAGLPIQVIEGYAGFSALRSDQRYTGIARNFMNSMGE